MAKEEILEGLKSALARGEPINKAMLSFYYAGYKKEEIQEAANEINKSSIQGDSKISKQEALRRAMYYLFNAGYGKPEIEKAAKQLMSNSFKPETAVQELVQNIESQKEGRKTRPPRQTSQQQVTQSNQARAIQQKPVQPQKVRGGVSEYGRKKSGGKLLIIILVVLLLLLLGILAGIFFFREDIVNFFNNLI